MLPLREPENIHNFVAIPLHEIHFVCNMSSSWYTKTKNNSKHATEYFR
jgi:hypothetical protein